VIPSSINAELMNVQQNEIARAAAAKGPRVYPTASRQSTPARNSRPQRIWMRVARRA
jgi:hypothetical protein